MRFPPRRTALGPLVLAPFLWAPSLNAQSVTGTILGPDQRPLTGVVVELLDSSSTAVARAVVNANGGYLLRATRGGRYAVRARQIGWRPIVSEWLELSGDVPRSVSLAFRTGALALDTVRVGGRSVCGRANDSTSAVVAALEYARTALLSTNLTRTGRLASTSVRYERVLDPLRERVTQQQTRVATEIGAQPWVSFPIDTLRQSGYVVAGRGDSTLYRLPGLDMLASTAFVDDHCFQFNGKSDKSRIGISFEPTPTRRKLADIKGTIWLDRTTAALKSLEFRYANLEGAQDDAKPGGSMQFARLSDGTWAVTQWSVRMPLLERRLPMTGGIRAGSGVPEVVVAGILVTGGEISLVTSTPTGGTMAERARAVPDTLWTHAAITVSGVVTDTIAKRPIAGATVQLMGTAIRATTTGTGAFVLTDVLAGEYVLTVRTPSLDSVRTMGAQELVVPGPLKDVAVPVSDARAVVAQLCPATAASAARGVLVGQVTGDATAIAEGVRIAIEWPTEPDGSLRWIAARASADGTFRACGLPLDQPITVRAMAAATTTGRATRPLAAAPARTVIAPATRFAGVDLVLDTIARPTATFTGTVVLDSVFTPIPSAEVLIPALGRSVRTNADGQFRLSELPDGAQRVQVRRIGYAPLDATLTFDARETVDRRIVLGRISVLDSVVVVADRIPPNIREFEEHRRLGIGKFLTRVELDRQKNARMSEVLATINGVKMKWILGRLYASAGRRIPTGAPHCYFLGGQDTTRSCVPIDECLMQVWLDTRPIFLGKNQELVPDFSEFRPEDLEGVEIYASAAETPARYTGLGGICGTIVLHRRRN